MKKVCAKQNRRSKLWGPSENWLSNSEMVAKCLRISLGFSLQQKFSLATVFSEFGKGLANLANVKFR